MTSEVIQCFHKDNILSWKQINPSEPIGNPPKAESSTPNRHIIETMTVTGENKAQIRALEMQIAELQSKIVTLSNQKGLLEKANTEAKEKLTSLEKKACQLKAEMNTVINDLKALHEIVSSFDKNILHFLGKKEQSPNAGD